MYIAVVGGDPATIAKERVKAVRRGYVDALIRSQKMKEKRTSGGEAPVPNKCEHVKALRAIRSIKDTQEQVIVMLRFLSKYQGDSDEHITNCIICKKFLVCKHEILQLQQAIHPRKEEVIAKQLHLDFAGGSFGKYYICKICGQPFSEIGYDTHIEFDDEGRPMMGRSVMEKEEDPITIQDIDDILGVQEEGKEEYDEKFASPLQDELAKITRKISSKVGIYIDRLSMEWIVSSAETSILSEYSQEEYLKKQETMKAIAKKKGVPAPEELDYQIFISRMTIAYTTAYLLIDIQTKMPNYQVTSIMPGCIPGFSGVPLDSQEDQTGIQYISCAVAAIMDKFAPWNKTSYQRQSNYSKRQKIIAQYMMGAMKKILLNANVITRLADKREYLLKQYGIKDGRHAENIPALLKPTQLQIEAVDIIEPPTDGVSGWILTAHKVARESGILLKGSPFVEANCCVHQVNKPTAFWDSKDMPPLENRKMKEFRATSIVTQDKPRDIAVVLADAPEDFYYRLFLKVCFKGDNEGYPHEVGFDNVCTWCGFVFPEHPSTLDPDTKGREAIENQPEKPDINPQTFQNLLDAVHRNYNVDAYRPPSLMSAEDRLLEFVRLDPSPMQEWSELLTNIHTQFVEFSKTKIVPNNLQVGTILGPISEIALANANKVKSKIGTAASNILDSISVMPADEFTEVINAYFITPFMRLITNTSPDIYKKAIKGTKLSYMHVEDLRNDINSQMDYLNKYANKLSAADFTKKKIQYAIDQFSAFMKLKSVFRSMLMPGFQLTTEYIQKGILFGILNTLFNSTIIPPNAEGLSMSDAITDNSATLLLECIRMILLRFSHEKLSYSLEKIRADIAMSAEMEKVNMIKNYFDKMTDEEKEVALTMKRLGMGRFGSERANAVWKYNASRYDIEKMDRAEMGVGDFKPFESGTAAVDFMTGMDAGVDYGVGNDFMQEGSDDF